MGTKAKASFSRKIKGRDFNLKQIMGIGEKENQINASKYGGDVKDEYIIVLANNKSNLNNHTLVIVVVEVLGLVIESVISSGI